MIDATTHIVSCSVISKSSSNTVGEPYLDHSPARLES